MGEISPDEAAAIALGDESAAGSDGADGESSDAGPDTSDKPPLKRLFDANCPGPTVPELEGDYGLPKWLAILGRGCIRVGTGSGVPPIFEIIAGTALGVSRADLDIGGSKESKGEDSGADMVPVEETGI